MTEFQSKSHSLPKRTQRLVWYLPKNILIIPKTFEQIFCGLNFLEGVCLVTSGIKPTQNFIKRTSYHQSKMVVVVWCLGLLYSFRTWMICHNWWNCEFCTLIRKSWRRMSGRQLVTSSSSTLVFCSRTMIPNTHQQVHLWMAQEKCRCGQVKVRTEIQLRCCGMTLNSPFMLENSPMAELKQFCKEEWATNSTTAMWKNHCSCCCKGGTTRY